MPIHPTPAFFFSHGSTMMLGEESEPAEVWKSVGDEAQKRGVKSIVMMGAHWECTGNKIEVAMNPQPQKTPVAYVAPKRYHNFKLVPDIPLGHRVIGMLQESGFEVEANTTFDYIHDTFLILIRMFPLRNSNIPVVVISANARFDPHYHIKMGAVLRPLRYENVLIVGSGGTVHNLYRNYWMQMVLYRDNFAQSVPPGDFALEFRQAMEDAFTMNRGPVLRRAIAKLMKHPRYREAHGTDDHFISAAFISGVAGDLEDVAWPNSFLAECWELVNMANSQFQLGTWE
ncbi:aromatic ring-opening dioxygenase family protein [Talaromyces proteolyticus]|uniref:Aromatic ring-opening dioxygenase family protein n=1 Tax=Talaromyces proteolyticus TaxID=1131652 RepID=A0AAD4PW94_9EURO|nr:aromatic ring-opening dioxygenase family protein [Talaromyces proteolyticus]KAH8691284.1 aromatic ring-opening dioxygenase family protein [Talaromyces proteolyticus]